MTTQKKPNSPGACKVHSRTHKFRFVSVCSHKEDQWDSLIGIAKSYYDWYAYIIHEPETDESHRHLHILMLTRSPLKLDKHFEYFRDFIPKNMIEGIFSGRAFCRYLTHKDSPDKIQYNDDQVVSSDMNKYYTLISEKVYLDSTELWNDYKKLRVGVMNPDEFIEKYQREMASMPFYQKFSMLHKIFDQCAYTFTTQHASLSFDSGFAHPPESLKKTSSFKERGVSIKNNRKESNDSQRN